MMTFLLLVAERLTIAGNSSRTVIKMLCGFAPLVVAGVVRAQDFTPIQPSLFGSEAALSSAWGDYDGDGDSDLAVTLNHGEVRLYQNRDGEFANVGAQAGLLTSSAGKGEMPAAVSWGDYDADGDLDLYLGTLVAPVLTRNHLSRNYLYRNDGERGFVEVAQKLGVDLPGADTRQVSWIDFDNDGDLDLFLAQRSSFNRLFRNDAGGFHDVTAEVGLFDVRRTVGACWFDMDQDGDLDVFQANQNGDKDALYRNDHGKFIDIAPQNNMHQPLRTINEGSVGCSVGDFDNDGDLDIFVATYGQNLLYRNDGKGSFEDIARQVGIVGSVHSVGASWGDYDNDGYLDLYVTGYLLSEEGSRPHARLFHNKETEFVSVLNAWSVLNVADHAVQWADYDRDGDLDLALTSTSSFRSGPLVLRNELRTDRRRRSLQVSVLDADGNFTRAGAEVRLYDAEERLLGTRLIPTSDGYTSQSAIPVHFGVPQHKSVTVEVTFLTRAGRQKQRLRGIEIRNWAGKVLIVKQN